MAVTKIIGGVGIDQVQPGAITATHLSPNTVGNGPSFSAYLGSNQSISSGVWTKVNLNSEQFDKNNFFDNTNYKLKPTVAGYYLIQANLSVGGSSIARVACALYKNGSIYEYGTDISTSAGVVNSSFVVYMNGTTDYIELYGFVSGMSPVFNSGTTQTKLTGVLVRTS